MSRVLNASWLLPGYADATEQNPTTLLWTLFFAAQHYAQQRDFTRALALIDEAIAHTPTVVELHHGKAKILKVCANAARAALRCLARANVSWRFPRGASPVDSKRVTLVRQQKS